MWITGRDFNDDSVDQTHPSYVAFYAPDWTPLANVTDIQNNGKAITLVLPPDMRATYPKVKMRVVTFSGWSYSRDVALWRTPSAP
jgi:hypothetical protein